MDFKFYIDFGNGFVPVTQPRNAEAMRIELLWDSPAPSASLQSINFEWLGDTAKKIYDYRQAGLTGGLGIFFGLPLKIEPCEANLNPFYLLINLIDESAEWECDRVVCPLLDRAKKDWLNDIAASFTFSYLATPVGAGGAGLITIADYKQTPYCISEIPDYTTVAALSVNLFLIGYEIVDKSIKLGDDTVKFAGDIATFATVPIGLEEISRIVLDAIIIIVDIGQLFILIQLFIDTFNKIINAIIQSKKYKYCMREKDLWLKACQHLGLTFSSSIYASGSQFENATDMPSKIVQPKEFTGVSLNLLNFDRPEDETQNQQKSYGYYNGTFRDFIAEKELKYNAEAVVYNGVLYFEEKNSYNNSNTFIIPNTGEVGFTFNLPDPHGTNAHELPMNYAVRFAVDESELNTLHRYEGTTCQYQISALNQGEKKNFLGAKGVVVDLPVALGKRKDYLTRPEQFLMDHETEINAMVDFIVPAAWLLRNTIYTTGGVAGVALAAVLGGLSYPSYTVPHIDIGERIGWLLLSNDSFNVPKTFIGTDDGKGDWEVHPDSAYYMSAERLMEYYHRNNLGTHGNQWLTYKDNQIKMCCEDLQTIMGSNVFKTTDNKTGKFTRLLWNPTKEIAEEIEYKVNEMYDKNMMKETISVNGEIHA